tara:strand:- start:2174 stop:2584 length:411 start_codon:yes stop_codon:yes gene_type:complete
MNNLTGKLGKYQDDLSELPELPITRYERSLKVNTTSKDGKEFYIYNILSKIDFPDNLQSDILDLYTAKADEPLTTSSYNIYDDIDSWWLLYLINKPLIGNAFFVSGGTQLQYILPEFRDLVYNSITRATIFDNRHF